jgi:hypothetical protein
MFFGIGFLAIFLSVIGTRVYQRRFEKEDREFTNYQKLILQRIDNVEKIQEKIQKDLADLIEKQKEN